jgi:hypothetical protein
MYCNYCRALNPDDSVFCSTCGRTIGHEPPAAQKSNSRDGEKVKAQSTHPPLSPPEEDFVGRYSRMNNEELIGFRAANFTLRRAAQEALEREITKRGLGVSLSEVAPDIKHKGVRGWLRLFVFCLLIFNPIWALIMLARMWSNSSAGGSPLAGHITSLIQTSIIAVITGYGIYAGSKLNAVRPGAVAAVKTYLKLWGLLAIGSGLLAIIEMVAADATDATVDVSDIAAVLSSSVFSLISAGVWWSYFSRSKRVAATYSS